MASRTRSPESAVYRGIRRPRPLRDQALGQSALGPGADGEAVGHPGQVVDHAIGLRRALLARRQLLRVVAEPVEEPAQDPLDLRVLGAPQRTEKAVRKHEAARPNPPAPTPLALHDAPR